MQKIQTFFGDNKRYTYVILALVIIAGLVTDNYTLAMWFGFIVAGFSAVSNDSIQTLGTFLAANKKVAWYWLWAFIGGIMVLTVTYGWLTYAGDISYGRLNQIPQPQSISFIQLLAPIALIVLTRFRMPVSTTFLILAAFSSTDTINAMLNKTMIGYFLAFFVAILTWGAIGYVIQRYKLDHKKVMSKKKSRLWQTCLWLSAGFLWMAWLMQDNANAAVFLPRSLSIWHLVGVIVIMLAMLAYILRKRGGEIQSIVTEKTDVTYVKSATLINVVYGVILIYFKWMNDLPMSTTWVFLGLLAGREVALTFMIHKDKQFKETLSLVMKDIAKAIIGLVLSILLAYATKLF